VEARGGRLSGKAALITGGARGIGRATAEAFLREGARVALVDRDAEAGEAAARELRTAAQPEAVVFVQADVARGADNQRMVREAEEAFGALHVLFLNAGISDAADDDAVATDEDVFDRTIAVNLKGVFLGCKHGIPALRRAGGGSLIATASFVAVMGAATPQLAYTASKGGVLALARELAVVHAREGIRVNALCPGPLRTELLMKYLDDETKRQRRLVHVPLGRFGEAREIAEAVVFLASDESSYVTGSTFLVDGGITAAYVTPEP
jgi:NAD(P)-dependent dehydrogenase (short-subunit alcohol dehydrogenase family)